MRNADTNRVAWSALVLLSTDARKYDQGRLSTPGVGEYGVDRDTVIGATDQAL